MYFDSDFKLEHIGEYCYQYFILLSKWLNHRSNSYIQELLVKLLSLENFSIRWYGDKSGIAAGTTSHRNPAYLLARIGKKTFNDDPKYLPIIMLKSFRDNKLFYHYRQYHISSEPDFSIFVYPAASLDDRSESFTLIESFVSGFSRKADPRSKQRAELLADSAIHPFLKSLLKDDNQERSINIVDLGGGSGIMLRHIWEHIINKNNTAGYLAGNRPEIRLRSVPTHVAPYNISQSTSYSPIVGTGISLTTKTFGFSIMAAFISILV